MKKTMDEHQRKSGRDGGHDGVSESEIGIKSHREMNMRTSECADMKYLGGMDPADYSLKQEDELARNVRKHHAP